MNNLRDETIVLAGRTFKRPRNFSADKFLKGSFGVFSGEKPIDVRIWLDAFAARLVRERTWHHSQEIHELPNDEVELKLTLTSTIEIAQWILGWGNHAKALAPTELVNTITKTLGETMRRYSTS